MVSKRALADVSDDEVPVKASHSDDDGRSPSPTSKPTTPAKKPRKTPTSTPGSASKSLAGAKDKDITTGTTDWTKVDGWTPEKKEAVMAYLITKGLSATGAPALAQAFGVPSKSMSNALATGRPGNLRDKAVKAVRG